MDIDPAEKENDNVSGWEDIEGEDAGLFTLPPGEEGLYHSHAGGETIFQQIIDGIEPQYVCIKLYDSISLNLHDHFY
jgi:hypothetical protein